MASNSITVNGATLTVNNAVSTPTLNLTNAVVAGTGSIQATLAYNFQNLTSSKIWGGIAVPMNIGGDSNTVKLTGANTYSGPTTIYSGSLNAVSGVGLPTASNLQFDGGTIESLGTFTRGLGAGNGQVQWISDGGFAAQGGTLQVTLAGAPNPLVWAGTANFVSSRALVFGNNTTADSEVVFNHNIDFNGAQARGPRAQ